MKHLLIVLLLLGCMAGGYSCKSGPSKEELAAQEQARIDSIKKATEDSIRLADSIAKVKADSIAKAKADSIANSYGIFDIEGNPKDGSYTLNGSEIFAPIPDRPYSTVLKIRIKNGVPQLTYWGEHSTQNFAGKISGKRIVFTESDPMGGSSRLTLTANDKLGTKWAGNWGMFGDAANEGDGDGGGYELSLKLKR